MSGLSGRAIKFGSLATLLAFLVSACGSGAPSVTTSPEPGAPSIVTAVAQTDSDGKALFHDTSVDQDIAVHTIDEDTNAGVSDIEVHLASDGEHVLVVAEDPQGRYAPGIALESYENLQRTPFGAGLIVANPAHLGASVRAVAIEPATIIVILTAASVVLTTLDFIDLAIDPPTLLEFSILESTFCATPDQLANLTAFELGVGLLLIPGGGVVMAGAKAIAPKLVELGVTEAVDTPVTVKVYHLNFLARGLLPILEIGGPCEPGNGPQTPPPTTPPPTTPPPTTPPPVTAPPTRPAEGETPEPTPGDAAEGFQVVGTVGLPGSRSDLRPEAGPGCNSAAYAVAVHSGLGRAYITEGRTPTVRVVDGTSLTILPSINVDGEVANGIAIDSATGTLFVGYRHTYPSRPYVAAVDPDTSQILREVPLEEDYACAVGGTTVANGRVWQAIRDGDPSVVKVVEGDVLLSTLQVGRLPWAAAGHEALDKVYIVNRGSNNVSVIDASRVAVVGTIAVGKDPVAIAVDPVTDQAFVASWGETSVHVIDVQTDAVIAAVELPGHPSGVSVNPQTGHVFVSMAEQDAVAVFDATSLDLLGTVAVGDNPWSVGVDSERGLVYVVNMIEGGDRSVSIIQDSEQ